MSTPPGPAVSQSPTVALAALGVAVAALAVALYAAIASRPAPPPVSSAPPLAMAVCTGAVAESPDDPFWEDPA